MLLVSACAINANDAESNILGEHGNARLNDNASQALYRVALMYGGVPEGDLPTGSLKGISSGLFGACDAAQHLRFFLYTPCIFYFFIWSVSHLLLNNPPAIIATSCHFTNPNFRF